eukprot:10491821-Alexandrium_andersonii.AAC.1
MPDRLSGCLVRQGATEAASQRDVAPAEVLPGFRRQADQTVRLTIAGTPRDRGWNDQEPGVIRQ